MSHILMSVEELIEQTPHRDNQETFKLMWGITTELRQKLESRFELKQDSALADLSKGFTSLDGSAQGNLSAMSGPEIDWMIHSFMGTPAQSFTNMHLTVWLGSQVNVPHFGMALGTIPDMFVYLDYIPRVDMMLDVDYLDRYFEPHNQTFLDFEADQAFSPFVSRCLYMRQSQSDTSLCYMAKPTIKNIEKVQEAAHTMMDRWLDWVKVADSVSGAEQVALAQRDLLVRKTISQRDPANVMGEKLFGKKLTDRLVGSLWGKGRNSERAGSWQQ